VGLNDAPFAATHGLRHSDPEVEVANDFDPS